MDYVCIGSTPSDEPCQQVGTAGYSNLVATAELQTYMNMLERHGAELECYELENESILDPYLYGEMYANRLGFDCCGGDEADFDFRVTLTDDPGGVRVFKSAVFWFVEE